MSMRLIKDEPPKSQRGGGPGRNRIDLGPMLKALADEPGQWFRYPRDYSGYPLEMKKRFVAEGCLTTVRSIRNDDGTVIGHRLWVQWPANGEAASDKPPAT